MRTGTPLLLPHRLPFLLLLLLVVAFAGSVGVAAAAGPQTASAGSLLRSDPSSPLTDEERRRAVTTVIEHHSFSPPLLEDYYGEGELPHWTLGGTTVVTDSFVRLTTELGSTVGHLWNDEPLMMPSFEIIIGFRVHSPRGTGADGFALWLTTERSNVVGPLFGHNNVFTGIGLLFDSYDNDLKRDNPMVGLIKNSALNSRRFTPLKDFFGEMEGSCVFDYRNTAQSTLATARLTYQRGTVHVYLSRSNEEAETLCFTARGIELDLDRKKYFIGLTAETGGVSDTHDVVFLHTQPLDGDHYDFKAYEERKLAERQEEEARQREREEMNLRNNAQGDAAATDEEAQRKAEIERLERLKREVEEAAKRVEGNKPPQGPASQQQQSPPPPANNNNNNNNNEEDQYTEEEEEEQTQAPKKRRRRRRTTTTTEAPDDDDEYDDEYEEEEETPKPRRRARTAKRR